MIFLIPFILLILIIFTIDKIYFDDVKPTNQENQKIIVKEDNKTDSRKNYIDKYLKK